MPRAELLGLDTEDLDTKELEPVLSQNGLSQITRTTQKNKVMDQEVLQDTEN